MGLHDNGVEIHGSKAVRKMLLEALPRALGDGAAIDERHAYQKIVASAIGDVLSAEVTKWTEKVAAAQAELDEVNASKATKDGTLAEHQKRLDDKKADIAAKKEKHHDDKEAKKAAEHTLADANSEVEHFDEN